MLGAMPADRHLPPVKRLTAPGLSGKGMCGGACGAPVPVWAPSAVAQQVSGTGGAAWRWGRRHRPGGAKTIG
eukprot:scaffold13048_cov97-Isochrysis_galbana.AAC.2